MGSYTHKMMLVQDVVYRHTDTCVEFIKVPASDDLAEACMKRWGDGTLAWAGDKEGGHWEWRP